MVEFLSLFVQSHKDIQGMNKLVLYRLLQIFKPPFEIKFSIGELASELRLSKSQVTSAINTLVKVGFLDEEDDFERRRGGGRIISSSDYLEDYLVKLEEGEETLPNASIAAEILDQITSGSRLVIKKKNGESGALPIEAKGQILLAVLIALADEDGVVESVAFSTLMAVTGLKRAGVQGVIRKLRDENVIAFYQPGRLAVAPVFEGAGDVKVSGRAGVIYLDLSKVSASKKFFSSICSSTVEEDFRRLKRLAGILSMPGLSDEAQGHLAKLSMIDKDEYVVLKGFKRILEAYMDNNSMLQSLSDALYLSFDSYFSSSGKCPRAILNEAGSDSLSDECLRYLTNIWGQFGFRGGALTPSGRLSLHLLKKQSEKLFKEIRLQLGCVEWSWPCNCNEEERCVAIRIYPLDRRVSSFLLLMRPLVSDQEG